MKKTILTLSAVFFAFMVLQAQEMKDPNAAQIKFEKDLHDFGTIEKEGNGTYEFVFTNNGKSPLIINGAKGSCGCTVPEWPKDPIAPGSSGRIKVTYDTKRVGSFTKTVTITSNAEEASKVIKIKGKVEAPAPEDVFPGVKEDKGATPFEN